MIRSSLLGFALALGLTLPLPAAETEVPLPDSIQRILERQPDEAIQQFAEAMLELHPEGIISQDVISKFRQLLVARARSQKLQAILAYDLDFDGALSREELEYARSVPNKRGWLRRPQLELMILNADLDMDGALDFGEIRHHVVQTTDAAQHSRLGRRTAVVTDLLVLDIDGDGTLSIAEMAKAIRELDKN